MWHLAQWISPAPPHHFLPAFLNLNGTSKRYLVISTFLNSENAVKINKLTICSKVHAKNLSWSPNFGLSNNISAKPLPGCFSFKCKTCKGIFNKRPVRCSSILNNVKKLPVLKLARIYINYIKWNRIFLFVLFWWEFWLLKVRSVREVVKVFGLGPNRSNFAWSVSSPLVSSCRLCSFDT